MFDFKIEPDSKWNARPIEKSDAGSYIIGGESVDWMDPSDAFKCEKSNDQIGNPLSARSGSISGTTFQNGIGRTRRIESLSPNFHLVYSAAT